MAESMPKHKIKDSVFTNLFRDKKYLLQLYKSLHPEDINVTEDKITNVTISHVMINADYNDLGFFVGGRLLILVESQSTWTLNIIVRAMMYLAQTYHDYFKTTNQSLYGSRKVNMPKPELYVIYTGKRKNIPDIISLRDEFFNGEEIAVDVRVKVLYHENEDDIIGQYIIFSKVYNEQRELHGNTKYAITETIRICKDRNVLKEYLESREKEVVDIMMALFDEEWILKAYAKEIEDNAIKKAKRKFKKEMEEEVVKKAAKETAERMIKIGKLPLEEIADYVPSLSMEELKELETKIMQVM